MPTTKIEHKAEQKQKKKKGTKRTNAYYQNRTQNQTKTEKKGTKRTKEQFDDTKMGHQNPYIDERETMQ